MLNKTSAQDRPHLPALQVLIAAGAASLLWAYWGPFSTMAKHWIGDPQYSHGWVVPLFSLVLLWMRRDLLTKPESKPSWWGLVILAGGLGMRLCGTVFYVSWIENMSFLPCLAGIFVLFGGWAALRWAWPAIAFLGFMVPLPFFLETMLAQQLRRIATTTSVYAIQTIGMPALAEGTDIVLNQHTVPVAPACSGLGMLLVFFALSTGFVLVTRRPWLDKLVILASALPIAVIANIIRITLTAILFEYSASDLARNVFHAGAGYLMMVIGLLLLWLELKLLENLFIVEKVRGIKPAYAAPNLSEAIEPDLAGGRRERAGNSSSQV